MAKAVINLQKESGGIVKISPVDGIGITEVIVPESGELATKFIGSFITAYTIFDNCIVAFGGEFNRADYPKLWEYLQANPTLLKTQAQWTTEATTNGGICGFFSDGDGTTTFRVPNLDKAFLRPDSRSIASFQGDAIRNITGTVTNDIGAGASGAFLWGGTGANKGGGPTQFGITTFDASRVVPTANENRPKNIAILPLIVAK